MPKLPSSSLTSGLLINESPLTIIDVPNISASDEKENSLALSVHSAIFSSDLPVNSAKLTTFLLINTMIGTGILNQPYVFLESGLLGGIFGFVIASVLTWFGSIILHETGVKVDVYDYSDLAKHVYGKYGTAALDWSIILGGFGSMIAYIVVVGETLSQVCTKTYRIS